MYQYFLLKSVESEYLLLSPLRNFFSIDFDHRKKEKKKSHSPTPPSVKWSFPKRSNGCYSVKERNNILASYASMLIKGCDAV